MRVLNKSILLQVFGLVIVICLLTTAAPADPLFSNYRGDTQRTGRASHVGPQTPANVIQVNIGSPIASSPAIGAKGTAYFGSNDNRLYAVSATGNILWSYQTGGLVTSSPALDSAGNIYVGSLDGYMYSVDPTGALVWRTSSAANPASPPSAIYSSPVITSSDSLIYSALSGYVFSLDTQTGLEQWRYRSGTTMLSSAAVSNDEQSIYIGGTDGKLHALSSDGALQWTYQAIDKNHAAPAVVDAGLIYTTSADGILHCLNDDGSLRWKFNANSIISGSPAVALDGTAYFGTYQGYMTAVSSMGTRSWIFRANAEIKTSPIIDSLGNLYFGDAGGTVYSLDSGGHLRWTLATGSEVTTTAIGADGSLYFGSQNGTFWIVNDGLHHLPEPFHADSPACRCARARVYNPKKKSRPLNVSCSYSEMLSATMPGR